MMEGKSFFARRKTDIIIGASFVLLLLIIYFHPSEISSRHNRALTNFPADGYVVAEDSQQYAATVTISLSLTDNKDEHEPDKSFITGQLQLEIYNIGVEPLRDFDWIGEFDQETQERLAWGHFPWLPPPGIDTSYSMLLSRIFRTKYDMSPRDAVVPVYKPSARRQPTSGFIYNQNTTFWYSAMAGDLDVVLACVQKPIKLKLMHEGGTDYLLVYPVIDATAITD